MNTDRLLRMENAVHDALEDAERTHRLAEQAPEEWREQQNREERPRNRWLRLACDGGRQPEERACDGDEHNGCK